jgi:ribosomal protein L35
MKNAKIKSVKALTKRFKITPKGKVIKRKCGQSHLNAKESGKITLNKRRDPILSNDTAQDIKKLLLNKR